MAVAAEAVVEAQLIEHRRGFARRWYRTPSFVAGVTILGLIVLAAIAAPLITHARPDEPGPAQHAAGPVAARTGSAPTTSAATSGRGSSTARAPT